MLIPRGSIFHAVEYYFWLRAIPGNRPRTLCKAIFKHITKLLVSRCRDVTRVFETANSFLKVHAERRGTLLSKTFSSFRLEQPSSKIAPNYKERVASRSRWASCCSNQPRPLTHRYEAERNFNCFVSQFPRRSIAKKPEWECLTTTQDWKQKSTDKTCRESTDQLSKLLHSITSDRKNKLMEHLQRIFLRSITYGKWRKSPDVGPRPDEKSTKDIFSEDTLRSQMSAAFTDHNEKLRSSDK